MYRLLITGIWVSIYSCSFIGLGLLIVIFLIITDVRLIDEGSYINLPWLIVITIAIVAFSMSLYFLWNKLVFTRNDFYYSVIKYGGSVINSGRCKKADFEFFNIEYCFPLSFLGYDIFWVPPRFMPINIFTHKKLKIHGGWMPERYLKSLIQNAHCLTIYFSNNKCVHGRVDSIYDKLISWADGRVVELWVKRLSHGETRVTYVDHPAYISLEPDDEIFMLVYVEPWRTQLLKNIIENVAILQNSSPS